MKGRELAETWLVAGIAAGVWYSEGFLASAVLWAAFFVCIKLDSVIEAVDKAAPSRNP
jgi:hypothetical protein